MWNKKYDEFALKNNWQKGFDLYYQPELPKFSTIVLN